MSYEASRCPVNKYCGFEVVGKHIDAVVEVCRYCNRKVIYHIRDGRVDNNTYLRDHVRDFCQPYGPTRQVYLEIYGEDDINRLTKEAEEKESKKAYQTEGYRTDMRNDLKIYKRLESKGYKFDEIRK